MIITMYNMPMRLFIIFLISLLLLTACEPVTRIRGPLPVDPEENARKLVQAGHYTEAAKEYLTLAKQDKNNTNTYRLRAIEAYIEAGQYNEANAILNDTTIPPEMDTPQNLRKTILGAYLAQELGHPKKALDYLQSIPETDIPMDLQTRYYDTLSRAHLAQGNYLKAASKRLRMQDFLHTPTEITQNNQSLWEIFETIPTDDLDNLRQIAPKTLTSWFELALLYQSYRFQPKKLKNAIDEWIRRYPDHSAYSTIVPELFKYSSQFVTHPQKIGLLLPVTGRYQKTSVAIRDGFIAAWYLDNQHDSEIKMYDTTASNIIEIYQQAVSDGVDYIVGPLEKEAITSLAKQSDLPVPILALNRAGSSNETLNSKLIQFGLSPEDEAIQVAEMIMSDGHTLALVITPQNTWGKRIADAFTHRWLALGGGILEQTYFSNAENNLADSVKELLNIDSSKKRSAELIGKLNRRIHTVERRRQDADFIFAAAVPDDARQLFPQLVFHRAGDLPVYATSHIFSGVVNSTKDIDMNGVIFADMPWILDTTRKTTTIQTALNKYWAQDKSNYRRLYALGIDAYRLIPEITLLKTNRNSYFNGETGDLRLDTHNIIRRKLKRAQFVDGKPVLSH